MNARKPKFTTRDGVTSKPRFAEKDRNGYRTAEYGGLDFLMFPDGGVGVKISGKKIISCASAETLLKCTIRNFNPGMCSPVGKYILEQSKATTVTRSGKAGASPQTAALQAMLAAVTALTERVARIDK